MFWEQKLASPLVIWLTPTFAMETSLNAAVKPVVASMPISLMRLETKKLPTETKAFCKMTGTEVITRSRQISLTNLRGGCSEGSFLSLAASTTAVSTADIACEMKVAHAAPATSQWNTQTNSRSSTTFNREDTTRKMKGVFESPIAEQMPQPVLYRKTKGSEPA